MCCVTCCMVLLCLSVSSLTSLSFIFFFKQKTAYEVRISDWSSDVCSSDLIGIGLRDRKLHALIGADRLAEQAALLRVGGRLPDEPFGIADTFGADQDPLGIHTRKDVAEPLPFLADQACGRHAHVIEEQDRKSTRPNSSP